MTPEETIRKFKEKYSERLKKSLNELAKIAGERTIKLVYLRTKAGFDSTGGQLKELSPSYKEFRKRWKTFLDSSTDPETSNLTATGQLLDAMYLRVVGSKFFIKVNTKNRDERLGGENLVTTTTTNKKGKKKSISYSKYNNDQIREFQEKAGREFLKLSKAETDELDAFCKEWLQESLSDIIKKQI